MTHLLVAVDKFTKWIEAKPIKKLNGPTTVTFIADITTWYGVPHSIITDNDTNFAKGALARFCATHGVLTHLLVAMDKFTNWIEVKPIKKLNGPTTVTFIADITV